MPENQNIKYKEVWRDDYLCWISGFAGLIESCSRGTLKIVEDCKSFILPESVFNYG